MSFNSPQCGWMSIGFEDEAGEFHTTTAHAPHSNALSNLLNILVSLLKNENYSQTLKWNRDPEEFDFVFRRSGGDTSIEIIEFPTESREEQKGDRVFSHVGDVRQIAEAFHETFEQLYVERNIDEFEDNWHQKFPFEEFKKLKETLARNGQ